MTDYYAVGTGNFQGGNIWALTSGGAASVQTPTSSDNVIFDTHSTGNVTIGTNSNCLNFTMTAPGAGTITMGGTAVLNIYGSMTLNTGMTFAPNVASIINFLGTTTGLTIKHAGYLLANMNYNGVGGEWTWQDNQTNVSGAAVTITLTNGSLLTNGFSAGAANGISLSSSNSNVRSLTLGSTTWKLNPTQQAAIWDLGTTTNLTFSAASSTIVLGGDSTFNGGGLTYGTVTGSLLPGNGADNLINGANTFANLTLSNNGNSQQDFAYRLSADQVVTGTFTANGSASTANTRNYIASNIKGTQRTITAATVSASYLDLQDIIGAGAASWNLSAITGLSGDMGGNSGITFTPATSQYYRTTNAAGNDWSQAAKWFTATGGGGSAGHVPLPQDTAIFDANSFTAANSTLGNSVFHLSRMDWTGVSSNTTFQNLVAAQAYGDMTLSSGMVLTLANAFTFQKRGALAVTTNGLTLPWPITLDSATGSWPLTTNVTTSNTFLLTSGTLALSAKLQATAITLAGGTTTDAGAAGEYKGTTFSATGGTHVIRKLTLSSTFAQSGSSSITVPVGGSGSWATSWTWTGVLFTFLTQGPTTWTAGTYLVGASSSGVSWLSC